MMETIKTSKSKLLSDGWCTAGADICRYETFMFIITLIFKITRTIKSTDIFTEIHVQAVVFRAEGGMVPGVEQQLSRWCAEHLTLCFNWQNNTGKVSATHPRAQARVSVSLSRHWDPRPTLPLGCSCLRFGQLCFKKTNMGVNRQRRQDCWDWPKWKHACQHWLAIKQEVDWSAMEMTRKTIASAEWTPWQTHPHPVLLY